MDDAIVIGGSFAGLSAALQLGRARRRVTVIDTGMPRNRYAAHAHGMLGHDGKPPSQILAEGRAQLATYPTISIVDARASAASGSLDDFTVTTETGEALRARRLILSYGITDIAPDIHGFAECWGTSVLHCPYCHGFEVADRRLGVLYSSPMSLHAVSLLPHWTNRLTLFANGMDVPAEEIARFAARGVTIIGPKVVGFQHEQGQLSAVLLDHGASVPLDAIFAAPRQRPSVDLQSGLGLDMLDGPLGQLIRVNEKFETSLPGVYASGDVASPMQSAQLALSNGGLSGVMCHQSLVLADMAAA